MKRREFLSKCFAVPVSLLLANQIELPEKSKSKIVKGTLTKLEIDGATVFEAGVDISKDDFVCTKIYQQNGKSTVYPFENFIIFQNNKEAKLFIDNHIKPNNMHNS